MKLADVLEIPSISEIGVSIYHAKKSRLHRICSKRWNEDCSILAGSDGENKYILDDPPGLFS